MKKEPFVSEVYGEFDNSAKKYNDADRPVYLHWAPFPQKVENFSWLKVFYNSLFENEQKTEHLDTYFSALDNLKKLTFRGIDFSKVSTGIDIGFGYANDLINLSKDHPHLQLHGMNISEDQVEAGRVNVAKHGLEDKIELHHGNSATDKFFTTYDLMMGFQVIHHIHDKTALFSNLYSQLKPGGMLVASDIVSNINEAIDHEESEAHFIAKSEYGRLLAENNLRVESSLDISQEVANFFEDDDFDTNLEFLRGHVKKIEADFLIGPHMLGKLLRNEIASYVLLHVVSAPYYTVEELAKHNEQALVNSYTFADFEGTQKEDGTYPLHPTTRQAAVVAEPTSEEVAFKTDLLNADNAQRIDMLRNFVVEIIAEALEIEDLEEVDTEASFLEIGLDSFSSLQLRKKIQAQYGIEIEISRFFTAENIEGFVTALAENLDAESLQLTPAASAEVDIDALSEVEIDAKLQELLN